MTLIDEADHMDPENIDWFSGAPLGQLVYDRTYSRVIDEELGIKETWPDTVRRVVDGNLAFVGTEHIEPGEREDLYNLLLNRQLIPAGRHLWVTGIPGRSFTQNCHVAGFETGFADHCGFVFSELMKGGGVGANYSSRYLEALTPLSSVAVRFICSPEHADFEVLLPLLGGNSLFDPQEEIHITIPDTREGWVDALELLLAYSHLGGNVTIIFDLSDIRCKGTPIKGFGGIASGPEPLAVLLQQVANLTNINEGAPVLITPQIAMTIDHCIAGAVIAGNVRRSARMSIMHWNDPFIEWFLRCKSDHSLHWSTNISVEIDNEFFQGLLDEKSWASFVYEQVIDGMLRDGEPGFYNSSLASQGESTHLGATNPCGEMPLESWESCNLGHINLAFGTDEDHRRSFRLMARFLVRSSFCDIQDPKQRDVVERNRRIGVGFFGLQEWLGIRGIKYSKYFTGGILADHLSEWHNIVRTEADNYCDQLGINRCIKCTTLAPTGTIAKLAGTTEAGQCSYAKYYLRRVRYADNDPEVAKLIAKGIHVEPDIATVNTVVASFPCEDPILTRVNPEFIEEQHDIQMDVLFGLQALLQRYYVDNAISMTVNVPQYTDNESYVKIRADLSSALRKYLPHIKGTTVFPEASRPQSPIERITKEEYDLMVHVQVNAGESDQLIEDCAGGSCPIR